MNKGRTYTEEYVRINGIVQYFLHYPVDPEREVMLVIHGGPGQSEAPYAYYVEPETPEFTSVYYDQRGAGKTLRRNPTKGQDVNQAQLMEDLRETVRYIKEKYQKEKIVLSGHSWGSVLGLLYAHQHPEDVLFYLGAGQVIDLRKSEREIFRLLLELAKDNPVDCQKLKQLGDYPNNISTVQEYERAGKVIKKLKQKYGIWLDEKKIKDIFTKSPLFQLADVFAMMKASKLSRPLIEFLLTFNAEFLVDFQVPMYFIHGAKDYQISVTPLEAYLEQINAPDKALFLVPDAGHFVSVDNREGALSAIREIFDLTRFQGTCKVIN